MKPRLGGPVWEQKGACARLPHRKEQVLSFGWATAALAGAACRQ